MIRYASAHIREFLTPDTQGNIRTARKLVAAVDPNYLYAVVSGLHGDEPNQNGDFFAWDELVKDHYQLKGKPVYATWVSKPNLVNHDSMRQVGEVIDTFPIESEKSIDMIVKVARKHDWLVKPIEKGDITDVSMGCSVAWSRCSKCNHIAHDESEWCAHLSPRKLSLKGKHLNGEFIYEDNRDITGVELSWITFGEGADIKAEKKMILAAKENDMALSDAEIDALAGIQAQKSSGGPSGKPAVAIVPKGSIKAFSSVTGGGDAVVGGGGGGVNGSLLASNVKSLIAVEKIAASLGGTLTPQAVLDAFDNGDISKKDMVHCAAKLGLGIGLEPKAAYEIIAHAVASGAATPAAPAAITAPETPDKPESVAQTQADETKAKLKAQLPMTDEEKQKMDNSTNTIKELAKVLAAYLKQAEAAPSLDTVTENPKPPIKPATPGSVESVHPNPALKSPDALENLLSKTMDAQNAGKSKEVDKVDRVPEDVEIKTIDSGGKGVQLIDQEAKPQPDPAPGKSSADAKDHMPQETDTVKTMKGADGLNSKLEMPKKSSLAIEFVDDVKMPRQSYWRVAVNDESVFAVTAEKAYGKSLTPAKFSLFKSAAYGNELRKAISKKGLMKTLVDYYGGTKGAVLAVKADRIAQLDLGMGVGAPKAPKPVDGPMALGGDRPLNADPLPKMNIDRDVAEDLQGGEKKGKSPFLDLLVDLVAPVLVKDEKKWNLEDVVHELGQLSKGAEALDVFKGKLEKKVEELKLKRDKGGDEDKPHFPGEKSEEHKEHEAKETPKEEKEEHKGGKGEEAESPREKMLEAALKELTAQLPALAAKLEKGESAEAEKHLKIRAVQTKKLAVRMAQLGMIEDEAVNGYAAALAKKSDDEIGVALEMVARAESAQPKIEAARVTKMGEKLAGLTGGSPIASAIPGGLSDRTTEELNTRSAQAQKRSLGLDWSRPPVVDETNRKA